MASNPSGNDLVKKKADEVTAVSTISQDSIIQAIS